MGFEDFTPSSEDLAAFGDIPDDLSDGLEPSDETLAAGAGGSGDSSASRQADTESGKSKDKNDSTTPGEESPHTPPAADDDPDADETDPEETDEETGDDEESDPDSEEDTEDESPDDSPDESVDEDEGIPDETQMATHRESFAELQKQAQSAVRARYENAATTLHARWQENLANYNAWKEERRKSELDGTAEPLTVDEREWQDEIRDVIKRDYAELTGVLLSYQAEKSKAQESVFVEGNLRAFPALRKYEKEFRDLHAMGIAQNIPNVGVAIAMCKALRSETQPSDGGAKKAAPKKRALTRAEIESKAIQDNLEAKNRGRVTIGQGGSGRGKSAQKGAGGNVPARFREDISYFESLAR